jgi:hypothetical protein
MGAAVAAVAMNGSFNGSGNGSGGMMGSGAHMNGMMGAQGHMGMMNGTAHDCQNQTVMQYSMAQNADGTWKCPHNQTIQAQAQCLA